MNKKLKNRDRYVPLVTKFSRIMRLLFLMFILGINSLFAVSSYSQLTKISLKVSDTRIEEVLNQIENKSEFYFLFNQKLIDINRKVTINADNENVTDILDEVFAGTDVKHQVIDRQIILTTTSATINQQQQLSKSVSGKITDQSGASLPGVSVAIKGTTVGTITDANGNFSIASVPENATLQFSFVGMKKQEIAIGGKKTINVILEDETIGLEEVIAVGYGTQKKANLSGAVGAIGPKALENRPITNVGQGLQGVIPGLNIGIANGNSSTTPSFNVRGYTSINGGEPLILIDNVPTSMDELARLNTNDISNISVLKDASSAAIYGARAAFGVILITTKTGKSEKISVSFNANYSLRNVMNLPNIVTDPYTVVTMKQDVGKPSYNPVFSPEMVALAKKHSEDPSLSPYEQYPADPTRWAYFGRTNWFKELYKTSSPTSVFNVNISQKTQKSAYFLSAEYTNQDGMLNYGNDQYERYNMRGKVDFNVFDWLKIGNNTSFANTIYDASSVGGYGYSEAFYDIAHNHSLLVPKNPDGSWTTDPQGWLMGGRLLSLMEEGGHEKTDTREFSTSFTADLSILKNVWSIKADATVKRSYQLFKGTALPYTYRKGPNLPMITSSRIPTAYNRTWSYNYNVYNIYTDFHKTFGGKHLVTAILGFNEESMKEDNITGQRDGLISTSYPTVQLATGTATVGETINSWAVRGAFVRLNYVYNDRYIVEFNGRDDGTSRFSKDSRFGFFPSGSAAWVLSKENFMEGINKAVKLDNMKMRVSYGSLGNQNIANLYPYIPSMGSYKSGMILDNQQPIAVSAPGLVSNSLTWEKVSTIDGGIDLLFFNNRFETNFDYYTRFTKGMLTKSVTLPNVIGVTEPQENSADLKTKGWEVNITWRDKFNLLRSPFRYSITASLADSRAYITKFANPSRILSQYYVGQEIGEIWGLETEGFFQSDAEVKSHADQTQVGSWNNGYQFYAGDLKFKDLNNDGFINRGDGTVDKPGDFKKIGNSSSRLPFSFDLNADWKGFDIRAFFQGIGKRDWYPTADNQTFWGIYANPWANVLTKNMDSWTPQNPNAYFPRPKSYVARRTNEELGCNQTKYLQNAAYLRLQNLMIGYTLPASFTKKTSIERLRIYFSAENLFEYNHIKTRMDASTLTNDVNSECIYPMQRTFSFGLNLNF